MDCTADPAPSLPPFVEPRTCYRCGAIDVPTLGPGSGPCKLAD